MNMTILQSVQRGSASQINQSLHRKFSEMGARHDRKTFA
jgi:hypothetical protein